MNSSSAAGETVSLAAPTPVGEFTAHYSPHGLARVNFPAGDSQPRNSAAKHLGVGSAAARRWHELTTAALQRVLAGRDAGKLPPLDWTGATAFQCAVWQAMQNIPSGETRSYGEIAREIGRPKATRAVGSACGANPIPVLVPCHRVLAAHHRIGGFSGGLEWKRTLLEREGVIVEAPPKLTPRAARIQPLGR